MVSNFTVFEIDGRVIVLYVFFIHKALLRVIIKSSIHSLPATSLFSGSMYSNSCSMVSHVACSMVSLVVEMMLHIIYCLYTLQPDHLL